MLDDRKTHVLNICKQAALAKFSPSRHTFVPLSTIPDIFAAVQSRQTDHGIVPFYNTTHGAVIATLDSLASSLAAQPHARPCSAVRIREEIKLPIRHCLLGHRAPHQQPSADDRPAARWSRIARVYSHEQALGQCAGFLTAQLPQAERIAVPSTSRAAEMVAAARAEGRPGGVDLAVAAIGSEMATELYGVAVLEKDIQDNDDNTTRFFVLGEEDDAVHGVAAGAGGAETSLIVFAVSHTAPGALGQCLNLLGKHNLNAVGIQQRPPNSTRKEDAIFLEVQARFEDVANAMDELNDLTGGSCRWLGHWQA